MRTATRVITATSVAFAAAALFAAPAVASTAGTVTPTSTAPTTHRPAHHSAPVFVQTDNLGGNSVIAYHRAADGTLNQVGSYRTGGLGGELTGSVVDHLASQGSLAYDRDHQLLYAVNAGTNTLTVFAVRGERLERLQVIGSGGDFPVSLTVHGNLVYVVNARKGGSVQGFVRIGRSLVRVPAWHRALGLDVTQTPEFTHTPGQIAFTPDGSRLIVTTKGNGSAIDVFTVQRSGAVSARPVVNSEPGTVPFGVSFGRDGSLVVAEAGTNSVHTFDVGRTGTLVSIASVATGQAATCWVVSSGRHLYASNAGSATLSGYRLRHGVPTSTTVTPTDGGTVDAAATSDGSYLYVQAGAAGVVDEFAIHRDGSLSAVGSVTVPGGVGGEGIVAG